MNENNERETGKTVSDNMDQHEKGHAASPKPKKEPKKAVISKEPKKARKN